MLPLAGFLSPNCMSGPMSARLLPGSGRYIGQPPHALAGAIAPAMRCACSTPAGGQSPRPAPAPPMAGASHPPGRALAFVALGETVPVGPWSRRAGKGDAFPDPPGPAGAFKRAGPFSQAKGWRERFSCCLSGFQTFLKQPFSIPPLTLVDTSAAPAPPANPMPSSRLARNLPFVRQIRPVPENALSNRRSLAADRGSLR
jgi:hypothetical protein